MMMMSQRVKKVLFFLAVSFHANFGQGIPHISQSAMPPTSSLRKDENQFESLLGWFLNKKLEKLKNSFCFLIFPCWHLIRWFAEQWKKLVVKPNHVVTFFCKCQKILPPKLFYGIVCTIMAKPPPSAQRV